MSSLLEIKLFCERKGIGPKLSEDLNTFYLLSSMNSGTNVVPEYNLNVLGGLSRVGFKTTLFRGRWGHCENCPWHLHLLDTCCQGLIC